MVVDPLLSGDLEVVAHEPDFSGAPDKFFIGVETREFAAEQNRFDLGRGVAGKRRDIEIGDVDPGGIDGAGFGAAQGHGSVTFFGEQGRLQFLATMGCVAGAAALFADSAAGRKVVANSRDETTAESQ